MTNVHSVADDIRRVVRHELDDCKRAVRDNDKDSALGELDEADRKLKHIAEELDRLG
jgi:hypothetical protein